MGLGKRWQQIRTHILGRRLPRGLINWRYAWPKGDPQILIHRRLWWNSGQDWPRPIWIASEFICWIRWMLWYGWRATGRIVHAQRQAHAPQDTLSLIQQYLRTLGWALGWCIHPRDVYRFGLLQAPEKALTYVYDQETGAYHRSRNPNPAQTPASYACIQDKIALADCVGVLGIPVVATTRVIARATSILLQQVAPTDSSGPLFYKTRSGNQGRGAFALWQTQQGLQGRSFEGEPLSSTQHIELAWKTLHQMDDVLIQPLLTNHPDLDAMSLTGEAIIVRFISERGNDGNSDCLSTTLEVPAGKTAQHKTTYSIFPIDSISGKLERFPQRDWLTPDIEQTAALIWTLAPLDKRIPCWPALMAASFKAHVAFTDVRAIAWDWVITPTGPVLLEGNVGWGTVTPQILHGGFLKNAVSPSIS